MKNSGAQAGFTLIELMIVVVIIGLLAAIAIPNFQIFTERAKAARVKSNCHTVQLVAEDYASRADGVYANNIADAVPGVSIVDLLPSGSLLINPWTNMPTEPIDGAAAIPGQTGYRPVIQAGIPVGYIVDGYGADGTVITVSSM